MTILRVVTHPSPFLNSRCQEVVDFDQGLARLVDRMAEEMYASRGVGLAAPQLGVLSNVILIDASGGEASDGLVVMVNPKIAWSSTQVEPGVEGCLSLPGVWLTIVRSIACGVKYYDLSGIMREMTCEGMTARIVQHEEEHLRGVTLLDKVGTLNRRMAIKKMARPTKKDISI